MGNRTENRKNKEKTNMIKLYPNISIITLNANSLNVSIKRQKE